jgi:putative glycosyltransferase (TIGR04372 family)
MESDLAPHQKLSGGVRFIGPIIFWFFVLARKLNIIFFRYEDAFGHQAWNTEFFARKHIVSTGRRPMMIGVLRRSRSSSKDQSHVANAALLNHHKKSGIILVYSSVLRRIVFYGAAYQKIKYGKAWAEIGCKAFGTATLPELHVDQDSHHKASVAFPLLRAEEALAKGRLRDLGLKEGQYFCFHDRGLENIGGTFGIDEYRGTSVECLYLGIERLAMQGLVGVRIGFGTGGEWKGPPIINYAGVARDDTSAFTDIALLSMCKFFVGPGSGVQWCAMAFNRPVCLINAFPWPWTETPMRSDSVVIPKKYWVRKENRFLTIHEAVLLEKDMHWKRFYDKKSTDRLGLDIIPNSSEEISSAMIEINDRLNHCWMGDSFPIRNFFKDHNMCQHSKAYLGSGFATLNRHLLQ